MADFSTAKACVLENMRAYGCTDVDAVDANLNSYDDVFAFLVGCIRNFECDPEYLRRLLTCGDITELNAQGIYFEQDFSGTTLENARFIAFCTGVDTLLYNDGQEHEDVVVFATNANKIDLVMSSLSVETHIHMLHISGGSQVQLITNSDSSNLSIDILRVPGCKAIFSRVEGSYIVQILQANVFGGGYFGGTVCIDNTAEPCTDEVSTLTTQNVTINSIDLLWGTPGDSIAILVYYRKLNEPVWKQVDSDNEGYFTKSGFTFIGLEKDQYYEFKVVNVCSGGFQSPGVTIKDKTHR